MAATTRTSSAAGSPGEAADAGVENVEYRRAAIDELPARGDFDLAWELYPRLAAHGGGDPALGRRLPVLFAAAGLEEIGVHIEQPAGFNADTKLLSALTFESIADIAVATGRVDLGEIDAAVHHLHRFAARPDALLSLPRMVRVWLRVPAER
jgi:hypothetical protein